MIRYRLAALSIAAVAALIAWRLPWLPTWLRAVSATHAMVCVAVAVFARPAVEVDDTDDQWQPAPPDPTVLAGHREALNPVPAVARPPVDALLAAVPANVPVEASVRPVEAPDEVIAPEADDDRLARLEDQLRRVAEDVTKIGAVVEEVAELSATGIAQLRRQVQALEVPR